MGYKSIPLYSYEIDQPQSKTSTVTCPACSTPPKLESKLRFSKRYSRRCSRACGVAPRTCFMEATQFCQQSVDRSMIPIVCPFWRGESVHPPHGSGSCTRIRKRESTHWRCPEVVSSRLRRAGWHPRPRRWGETGVAWCTHPWTPRLDPPFSAGRGCQTSTTSVSQHVICGESKE